MTNRIIISIEDHTQLTRRIATGNGFWARDIAEVRSLEQELARAEVVPADKVPSDVIRLNSRATLLDLDANEEMEFCIVLPEEADISEDKISILAPIGCGMLGYRVGDEFEQQTPRGVRRLKVLNVQAPAPAGIAGVMIA